MKIVIDIPESAYEAYKAWDKSGVATVEQTIIANGTPVQTGEWIEDELHNVVCSICGGIRRDCRVDYINYCNKCGAKMKGGAENDK